jgi:hypothetical protein
VKDKTLKELREGYNREASAAANKLREGGSVSEIEDSLRRMHAYSKVLDALKPGPTHNRLIAISFGLICLLVGGLLWSLTLADFGLRTHLRLEVHATSVQLELAEPFHTKSTFDEAPASSKDQARIDSVSELRLPVFDPKCAAPPLGDPTWAELKSDHVQPTSLDLVEGAQLELSADGGYTKVLATGRGNRCVISFSGKGELISGKESGNNQASCKTEFDTKGLEESINLSPEGRDAKPTLIRARLNKLRPMENLKAARISFSERRPTAPGEEEFESAITKGAINVLDIGSTENLERMDLLSMWGLDVERLKIWGGDDLTLYFEGSVKQINVGPRGHQKTLSPSLLKYVHERKPLAFFWSAAVFLWGILWGVKKTLFA